jgi:hypothetical protein
MAFFVEESENQDRRKKRNDNDSNLDFDDFEIMVIVNAKRAGLSFTELNELRVCDYIKFMEIYTGEAENKPRQATQDDIDRLLG